MYAGPSCVDRPIYEELGDMEIITRIHNVTEPPRGGVRRPGSA
jgi:hypothetical protein